MGRHLLLASLSLALLLPASAQAQSAEPALTGRAAIERIIGNTVVLAPASDTPLALEIVLYFAPDGRAVSRVLANGVANESESMVGKWSIDEQERLCVVEEGKDLKVERDCVGMIVTGDTVTSVPEDIFRDVRATIVEGNLHEL